MIIKWKNAVSNFLLDISLIHGFWSNARYVLHLVYQKCTVSLERFDCFSAQKEERFSFYFSKIHNISVDSSNNNIKINNIKVSSNFIPKVLFSSKEKLSNWQLNTCHSSFYYGVLCFSQTSYIHLDIILLSIVGIQC